eukprot:tig00001003_g6289.t2
MRRVLVGVSGLNGSGKTVVCDYFRQRDYAVLSLSDAIRQEVAARGLSESRTNLIAVGNDLRKTYGPGVLAQRILAQLQADRNYVIDSIRHPAEVQELRSSGCFKLVAVSAPPEI